eukprot:4198486-Prymnesium_polylepis.3
MAERCRAATPQAAIVGIGAQNCTHDCTPSPHRTCTFICANGWSIHPLLPNGTNRSTKLHP